MEWNRIIGLYRDTSYFDHMEDCDIKTIIKHGKYSNLIRMVYVLRSTYVSFDL